LTEVKQITLRKSTLEKLTEKQRVCAEAIANPEIENTITAACKHAGVDRSSYYNWMRDCPEFAEYLEYLIEKYTDGQLGPIYKSLCSKAVGGNVQAMKLYFEVKGRIKKEMDLNINPPPPGPDEVNTLRELQKQKTSPEEVNKAIKKTVSKLKSPAKKNQPKSG